jgi:carboxyl-terminal processing protease
MTRRIAFFLVAMMTVGTSARGAAPVGLAARIWEITDAILDHHVDPSTRSQMILDGLVQMYGAAGVVPPDALARRVSAIASPAQLASLLDEVWPLVPAVILPKPGQELGSENPLIRSLLEHVPGGASMLSAKELKVEEQFAGNRYVGLHIALGMDKETKRPSIAQVIEGGPADRAGLKQGDLIEDIDGASTAGLDVKEMIDRLRGPEGSTVTIRVRTPPSPESRVLTITRGVLPHTTVKGYRNATDSSVDLLIPGPERVGYVQFEEILGSTPNELRVLARRLEEEGARAMILDLRPTSRGRVDFHSTVLLADCLLEEGTIGRVRHADRVETFSAEPDALFRDWPLFVLVDNLTPATAQWLAAALRDNHRAMVVGAPQANFAPGPPGRRPMPRVMPGRGDSAVRSAVPLGDGSWSIEMTTGRLERGDGRVLENALVPDITAGQAGPRLRRTPQPDPQSGDDPILSEALHQLRVVLK